MLFHNILTFYYQSNRPVRRTILSLFLLVNLVFCNLTWLWRSFFCVWHSGRCVCVTSTRRVITLGFEIQRYVFQVLVSSLSSSLLFIISYIIHYHIHLLF